jgi:geranylgeranyl reductase family protein
LKMFNVVIVGAGPAGTTLAYELGTRGIDTLVLEKADFPRYKCCGGGITSKTALLLNIDLSEIIEDAITGATIVLKGKERFSREYNQPIIYTVSRDKFDTLLAKRAQSAGVPILYNTEVKQVKIEEQQISIETNTGNFSAQYIIGADGAKSLIAKSIGVRPRKNILAIGTEIELDHRELSRWKSRVQVDLGIISPGYAWLFPKKDHVSAGVVCLSSRAPGIKSTLYEFINSLGFSRYTILKSYSSLIPVCIGKSVVARGRVFLVGDAAGLADPLTGEGIYSAVLSAKLAAPAIEKALREHQDGPQEYQRSVEENIMAETRIANMFSHALGLFPSSIFGFMRKDEKVWRACCLYLRGEIDYLTIKSKLKSIGGLYILISGELTKSRVNIEKQIRSENTG